jgi:pilus assembly protein CpaB
MILRKTKLIVYLAITFSFLASLSVFLYLRGVSLKSPKSTELYKEIVVAAADVEAGRRLTSEQLKVLSWPERLIPAGSFESPEDVVGKVISRDFFSGEPLLTAHLAKDGAADGLSSLTPPGMRAMSVSVNSDVLNDNFIKADSRVDVLATIKTENTKKGGGGYISKSILQNVKVLSVSNGGGGGRGFTMGREGNVTLLVTPEEAERLALAESQGVLYLVLRNISDQDPLVTSGATISSLIDSNWGKVLDKKPVSANNTKPPAKAAPSKTIQRFQTPPPVKIEVIRGMEREEMVFETP